MYINRQMNLKESVVNYCEDHEVKNENRSQEKKSRVRKDFQKKMKNSCQF